MIVKIVLIGRANSASGLEEIFQKEKTIDVGGTIKNE